MIIALIGSICIQMQVFVFSNPALATTIAFIVLFFIPGFLLTTTLFRNSELSSLQLLAASCVLGIGILIIPATLLLVVHASLTHLVWVSIGINIGLISWHLFWPRMAKRKTDIAVENHEAAKVNPFLAVGFFIGIVWVLVFFNSTAGIWLHGDRWSYIAWIRQFIDWPHLDPSDPHVASGGNDVRMIFSGWGMLEALLSKVSGVDPIDLFSLYLPPLLMVVSLLAFYGLARELFGNPNLALLSSLAQILFLFSSIHRTTHWPGYTFFGRIAEDKTAAWAVILPVALMMALNYLRHGKPRILVALGLSLAALAFTHPLGLPFYGILFASFAFVHVCFNLRRKIITRLAMIFSLTGIILIVPLIHKVAYGKTGKTDTFFLENIITDYIQLSKHNLRLLDDGRYVADTLLIEHPMIILAIVLTPLLVWNIRKNLAAQFLLSNTVILLLLLYHPLMTSWLGWLITPHRVWRISWLLPVALTIGFFLYKCAGVVEGWLRRSLFFTHRPLLLQTIPVVLIALSGFLLNGDIRASVYHFSRTMEQTISEDEQALMDYLRQHLTTDSTIMANHPVSGHLPAYSTKANMISRGPVDSPTRFDIRHFYQTELVDSSTIDILRRHDVRYVIIETGSFLGLQVSLLPSMFSKVYHNDTYELYEVACESQPSHVITGNTHFAHREWDKAISEYEKALELNVEDTLAYFGLGQVYQVLGEIEQAEAAYFEAINTDPGNVWARISLARVYVARGRLEEAIAQYETAIRLHPAYLAPHQGLGDVYLMQGRLDEAILEYEKAIDSPAGTSDYHLALGDLYSSRNLTEKAIAEYRQASTLAPTSPMVVYLKLGSSYQTAGELEKALAAYKQASAAGSKHPSPYFQIGHVYKAQGKSEEALTWYRKAVKVHPVYFSSFLAIGDLYLAQDNPQEASSAYQKAIEVAPDYVGGYIKLGQIYQDQGEIGKAIELFQQAAKMDSQSPAPYLALGRLYQREGDGEKAITAYQQAIATAPDNISGYTALGNFYRSEGDLEKAVIVFQQAVAAAPNNVEGYMELGKIYQDRSEIDQAITTYQQAIIAVPTNATLHFQLALLYEQAGMFEEAIREAEIFIALTPDDEQRRAVEKRLLEVRGRYN